MVVQSQGTTESDDYGRDVVMSTTKEMQELKVEDRRQCMRAEMTYRTNVCTSRESTNREIIGRHEVSD